jgi:hypothetical protein
VATSYTLIGGISRILATSFITEMLVQPACRCPRCRRGMQAAFLYWGGYLARMLSTRCWFSLVKAKGIDGLLVSVFLC